MSDQFPRKREALHATPPTDFFLNLLRTRLSSVEVWTCSILLGDVIFGGDSVISMK